MRTKTYASPFVTTVEVPGETTVAATKSSAARSISEATDASITVATPNRAPEPGLGEGKGPARMVTWEMPSTSSVHQKATVPREPRSKWSPEATSQLDVEPDV